jgi:hypothetical protein
MALMASNGVLQSRQEYVERQGAAPKGLSARVLRDPQ